MHDIKAGELPKLGCPSGQSLWLRGRCPCRPGSKHMVKTRAGAHNGQLSPCVGSGRGFGGFLGLRERLFSLSKCRRGRSSPGRSSFLKA
ncbi:hypothetical protein EJB05_28875, partial [Eragrostis curvula]